MTIKESEFLNHQDAATLNKHAILNFIRMHEPVSRTKIWEEMKLSRASVTQIIKQMQEQNLVVEKGRGESRGGRKPTFLEFNANVKFILVFEWDSRALYLVNLSAVVLHSLTVPIDIHTAPETFAQVIIRAANELMKIGGADAKRILGMGLIMPGVIDPFNGIIILSTVQNWENVRLKQMLEAELGIKVIMDTDTNMQALGECYYGAGRGIRHFVLMSLVEDGMGTFGLGTALVLDGELIRGNNHMSGEIGHVRVQQEGPLCLCGKRGCLEILLKESVKGNNGSWLGEPAKYVGLAIGMIVNILDPGTVVLHGAVIDRHGERLIREIKVATEENVLTTMRREVKIEKALLGQAASIKGICSLIYNTYFKDL